MFLIFIQVVLFFAIFTLLVNYYLEAELSPQKRYKYMSEASLNVKRPSKSFELKFQPLKKCTHPECAEVVLEQ